MFEALWAALFGLIVGSFVNVAVLRRGLRYSFTGFNAPSRCLSCKARLRTLDLIPVLSWLMLRGRCRSCKSAISLQYPLVEGLTALCFFLLVLARPPIMEVLLGLPLIALLMAISVYDMRHTVMPDAWVWSAAALALLILASGGEPFVFALAAGPAIAAPLLSLWALSGGRWMGLADAKLALSIGWLLGPLGGFLALVLSFVLGALVSVGILLPLPSIVTVLRRWGIARGSVAGSYTMKSEVPFGPFMVSACLIVWFVLLYDIHIPPYIV